MEIQTRVKTPVPDDRKNFQKGVTVTFIVIGVGAILRLFAPEKPLLASILYKSFILAE
jgi:hypothetical protein